MTSSNAEVLEAVDRAARRATAVVHAELQCDLSTLATIASTAPLVGAVGTLLGIVGAFRGCGAAKWTCIAATFEVLAHALAPTVLRFS